MSKQYPSSIRQDTVGDLLIITDGNKISINKYGYSVVVSIENNKATYNGVVIYDMEQDLVSFIDFLETKEEEFWERIYNVDHEKYKQYLESIGVIEYSSEIMYLVADLLMFLNNKNITDEIKKELIIKTCQCSNPRTMANFIKKVFDKYYKKDNSLLNRLLYDIGITNINDEILRIIEDLLLFLKDNNLSKKTFEKIIRIVCSCNNPSDMFAFIKELFLLHQNEKGFNKSIDIIIGYIQERIKNEEEIDFGNILSCLGYYTSLKKCKKQNRR